MSDSNAVLETMKNAGGALRTGDIVKLCGLDKKEVEKAMKELKSEGLIVSPKRCFWEPK